MCTGVVIIPHVHRGLCSLENAFLSPQICSRADVLPFAREEPESLSKNRQTSFNFRIGKTLHTTPASCPRGETGSSEESRDLSQAPWPEFGQSPGELDFLLKSGFSPEVEPLCCAVSVLCSE